MTHDQLKKRIAEIHNDSSDGGKPINKQYKGMLKFQEAVIAVVELHKPEIPYGLHDAVEACPIDGEVYPCATIKAIEKELK